MRLGMLGVSPTPHDIAVLIKRPDGRPGRSGRPGRRDRFTFPQLAAGVLVMVYLNESERWRRGCWRVSSLTDAFGTRASREVDLHTRRS
jgi:hypothetical protein